LLVGFTHPTEWKFALFLPGGQGLNRALLLDRAFDTINERYSAAFATARARKELAHAE
jgi:hypothetical protein